MFYLLQHFNLNIVMVMWRELFEAVLIVTIVYAILSKRVSLSQARRATGLGVAFGITASLLLGLGMQMARTSMSGEALDLFQIVVLIVCAALMTHMLIWMQHHAPLLKRELESSIDGALTATGLATVVGVITLAIMREGFEVVVFLWGMGIGSEGSQISSTILSALAGAALTSVSAYCLWRGIKFIKPKIFFQVTGIFLLLTASSLLLAAVQRGIQSGFFPPLIEPLWDTSVVLDEQVGFGRFVAMLTGYQSQPTLLAVLVYVSYWIVYLTISRLTRRQQQVNVLIADHSTKAAASMNTSSIADNTVTVVLMLTALSCFAPTDVEAAPGEKLKLRFTGYGDLQFAYHNYGANGTLKNGSQEDNRLTFDTTRFTGKLEGFYLPYNVEFEAEVEIEHGGTGAAVELEYDEAGEYETEVEKGGEVLLEEFYLKKVLSPEWLVSAGRIKVAFGLLSLYSTPNDYLAVHRAETETEIIPESWNEMGFEAVYENEYVRVYTQVVNGLDSTGFNSSNWVAAGHQSRFEEVRATDLAGVLRADILAINGATFGAAAYHGGTTRNRPKPDLVKTCSTVDEDKVAPCGYVDAPVTLVDLHGTFQMTSLRGNAVVLWGRLANAAKISERNSRLPNALGVMRTPVADEAYGAWGELGYDIAPLLSMSDDERLEPFFRFDQYDSMYKVKGGQIDNPRFARRVLTAGVAHTVDHSLITKLDVSRRTFGSKNLRPETSLSLGLGFIF